MCFIYHLPVGGREIQHSGALLISSVCHMHADLVGSTTSNIGLEVFRVLYYSLQVCADVALAVMYVVSS